LIFTETSRAAKFQVSDELLNCPLDEADRLDTDFGSCGLRPRPPWRKSRLVCNPKTGVSQPVPRHREIKEFLARHILKKLAS